MNMTFDAIGREELRQYIVAVRPAMKHWPSWFNNELQYARTRHDAGTHIMCQGRDGDIIIQYLIPRLGPPKPQNYFGGKSWWEVQAEENRDAAREPA